MQTPGFYPNTSRQESGKPWLLLVLILSSPEIRELQSLRSMPQSQRSGPCLVMGYQGREGPGITGEPLAGAWRRVASAQHTGSALPPHYKHSEPLFLTFPGLFLKLTPLPTPRISHAALVLQHVCEMTTQMLHPCHSTKLSLAGRCW